MSASAVEESQEVWGQEYLFPAEIEETTVDDILNSILELTANSVRFDVCGARVAVSSLQKELLPRVIQYLDVRSADWVEKHFGTTQIFNTNKKLLQKTLNQTSKFNAHYHDPLRGGTTPMDVMIRSLHDVEPTTPGKVVGSVCEIDETKNFAIVYCKIPEQEALERVFMLLHEIKNSFVNNADVIEGKLEETERGRKMVEADLLQESIISVFTSRTLDLLVSKYGLMDPRFVLVSVLQRVDSWKACLNTPLKSDGTMMMPRHTIALIQLSLRVAKCHLYTCISSYFNLFIGTEFLLTSIPKLTLSAKLFNSAALVSLTEFGRVLKQNAGVHSALKALKPTIRALKGLYKRAQQGHMVAHESVTAQLLQEAILSLKQAEVPAPQRAIRFETNVDIETSESYIFPKLADFRTPVNFTPEHLPKNLKRGAYESTQQYIRTHFELMRAEAFSELVFFVHTTFFGGEVEGADHKWVEGIKLNTRVYKDIHILGTNYGIGTAGCSCTLLFRHHAHNNIAWQISSVMERGNCLCITTDNFQSELFWAVVSDRNSTLAASGICCIDVVLGDIQQLVANVLRNQINGTAGTNTIMLEPNMFFMAYYPLLLSIQSLLTTTDAIVPFTHQLVQCNQEDLPPNYIRDEKDSSLLNMLIENCLLGAKFDAEQATSIQQLAKKDFIMVQGPPGTGKSFTGVKMAQVLSEYRLHMLRQQRMVASVSIREKEKAIHENQAQSTQLQEDVSATEKEVVQRKALAAKLQPDKSQKDTYKKLTKNVKELRALQDARKKQVKKLHYIREKLERELHSTEQQAMLDRERRMREMGPIVVITYKNHALDDFLLDCVHWIAEKEAEDPTRIQDMMGVVRIGGGSREEKLKQYSLFYRVKQEKVKSKSYLSAIENKKKEYVFKMKKLVANLQVNLHLTPLVFKAQATEEQLANFGDVTSLALNHWLGDVPLSSTLTAYTQSVQDTVTSAGEVAEAEKQKLKDRFGNKFVDDDEEDDAGVGGTLSRKGGPKDLDDDVDMERWGNCFVGLIPRIHTPPDVRSTPDIHMLQMEDRHKLALHWLAKYHSSIFEEIERLRSHFLSMWKLEREFVRQIQKDVLSNANVIGMTTTGCAMYRDLLQSINPSVLIVEEAAEILESQLLSCIANTPVQQIVLIGDHKQLKPSVAVYAHCKVNRLDLSMFERMENNGIETYRLTTQRRMIPPIADLVRFLYSQLTDAKNVLFNRRLTNTKHGQLVMRHITEPPPGFVAPVFFWNHVHSEEESTQGKSQMNTHELVMTSQLVEWCLKNGFTPEQITVMTPYKGQLKEFRRLLTGVQGLTVTTVDRYQGDENDIVILSLVRSEKLTEFIKRPDRMCVSLSRARYMFFCLGNADLLRSVPHWAHALGILDRQGLIGNWFPINCPLHPDQVYSFAPTENFHTQFCEHCNSLAAARMNNNRRQVRPVTPLVSCEELYASMIYGAQTALKKGKQSDFSLGVMGDATSVAGSHFHKTDGSRKRKKEWGESTGGWGDGSQYRGATNASVQGKDDEDGGGGWGTTDASHDNGDWGDPHDDGWGSTKESAVGGWVQEVKKHKPNAPTDHPPTHTSASSGTATWGEQTAQQEDGGWQTAPEADHGGWGDINEHEPHVPNNHNTAQQPTATQNNDSDQESQEDLPVPEAFDAPPANTDGNNDTAKLEEEELVAEEGDNEIDEELIDEDQQGEIAYPKEEELTQEEIPKVEEELIEESVKPKDEEQLMAAQPGEELQKEDDEGVETSQPPDVEGKVEEELMVGEVDGEEDIIEE